MALKPFRPHLIILLFSCYINSLFAQTEMEHIQWPEQTNCSDCIIVQYQPILMNLPTRYVGKVAVLNIGEPALDLRFKTRGQGHSKQGVIFVEQNKNMLFTPLQQKGLFEGLNIKTYKDFFEALGKKRLTGEDISLIRKIMSMETSTKYIHAAKDKLNIYWIKSETPSDNRIYFVIDGHDSLYLASGDISEEFFHTVLSGLRVRGITPSN
ncbi:MAG: hypothetical protein OEZ58_18965 [Gammaproteobacteria bacterium]|nr:hypothetical protein [Gammaproteobacteria bacterium]